MGRAPCCDKTQVKRGPWSPEEDDALKRYMKAHGFSSNWIALPQKAGLKRCGKSCRLRWLNYLRPDIKHGGFTPEEDSIICTLYSQMGSRWSIIASQLPGRTDNDVKNHWNTKLKKKLMAANRINAITSHATVMPATCTTNHHQLSPVPYKSRGCNSTGDEIETIDNILSYFVHPDHHQSQNYQPLSAGFSDHLPSSYGLKCSSTQSQKLMTNPDPPAVLAQVSGPDQGSSSHGYGNGEIVDQEAEILAEFGFEMVSYDENVVGNIIHESSPDMMSISTTSQVVASPTSVANLYY